MLGTSVVRFQALRVLRFHGFQYQADVCKADGAVPCETARGPGIVETASIQPNLLSNGSEAQ